jgi:hypothetical protein
MEVSVISRKKINIRFHNPNPTKSTVHMLEHIFIEVNTIRVGKILEEKVQDGNKKKVTA